MITKLLSAAAVLAAAFSISTYAQVEVVDRKAGTVNRTGEAKESKSSASKAVKQQSADLYYQMQLLQQEVLELRGLLEQQAYELKRLKQQRLDDYIELDRRISSGGATTGSSSSAKSSGNIATKKPTAAPASSSKNSSSSSDELQSYKSAIDLVLKKQEYEKAISALKKHLDDYPNGRYAGNAQYWLGEIYLLQNDLDASSTWFTKLLRDFPRHRKVPDAKFKLGKVLHQKGDSAKARAVLEDVASSDSSAASLARDYLKAKF